MSPTTLLGAASRAHSHPKRRTTLLRFRERQTEQALQRQVQRTVSR